LCICMRDCACVSESCVNGECVCVCVRGRGAEKRSPPPPPQRRPRRAGGWPTAWVIVPGACCVVPEKTDVGQSRLQTESELCIKRLVMSGARDEIARVLGIASWTPENRPQGQKLFNTQFCAGVAARSEVEIGTKQFHIARAGQRHQVSFAHV